MFSAQVQLGILRSRRQTFTNWKEPAFHERKPIEIYKGVKFDQTHKFLGNSQWACPKFKVRVIRALANATYGKHGTLNLSLLRTGHSSKAYSVKASVQFKGLSYRILGESKFICIFCIDLSPSLVNHRALWYFWISVALEASVLSALLNTCRARPNFTTPWAELDTFACGVVGALCEASERWHDAWRYKKLLYVKASNGQMSNGSQILIHIWSSEIGGETMTQVWRSMPKSIPLRLQCPALPSNGSPDCRPLKHPDKLCFLLHPLDESLEELNSGGTDKSPKAWSSGYHLPEWCKLEDRISNPKTLGIRFVRRLMYLKLFVYQCTYMM